MKQAQLIPKHRRKRQPTADTMREQLRLAADEIIRLRAKVAGPVTFDEVLDRIGSGWETDQPGPHLRNVPPPPNPPPARDTRGMPGMPAPVYLWDRLCNWIMPKEPK